MILKLFKSSSTEIKKLKKELKKLKRLSKLGFPIVYENYRDFVGFNQKQYWDYLTSNFPYLFTIKSYEGQVRPLITESQTINEGISYNFVPSGFEIFIILKLVITSFNRKLKLCDLGSGAGNIIYFANKMGYETIGVEKQEKFKDFYISNNMNFINEDLLTMDYSFMKDLDIVYIYRPLKYSDNMNYIIKNTNDNLKKGSLIIVNHTSDINLKKYKLICNFWDIKIIEV